MIDDTIKNCIWRKEAYDVYICGSEIAPCSNVIKNGKCDVLKNLFRGEDGNDD